MSSIGAVSSGMTQAMVMKPPPGPPAGPAPAARGSDSDGSNDAGSAMPAASPGGKRLDISA
jgi:hypothetical protein